MSAEGGGAMRACDVVQVGCAEIVGRIVEDLKDESEPYRRMVMETVDKVSPVSRACSTSYALCVTVTVACLAVWRGTWEFANGFE